MSQKKTETSTFRIEKEILEKLRVDADEEKISLNALVNQVLSQHIEWDAPAKKSGFVPLPKILLMKVMNYLTDEQIVQVSEYMVKNEIKDIILTLRNEHNVKSFLNVIESWAKTSGFPFSHEDKGSSTHRYVISHNMGKNWSLYYGIIFTRILEELGVSHINFEITNKNLNFNFTYII